jgi:hypothetical protein
MSLFVKPRKNLLNYKDKYFIFMGRWFKRTEDHQAIGCVQVLEGEEIPQEYLDSWADYKHKAIKADKFDYRNNNY